MSDAETERKKRLSLSIATAVDFLGTTRKVTPEQRELVDSAVARYNFEPTSQEATKLSIVLRLLNFFHKDE